MSELDPVVVAADDRGLAYGDGLFETLRLGHSGVAPLLDQHLARMADGARRLGIPFSPDSFRNAVAQAGKHGAGVLRLTLTRGSGGRGYLMPAAPRPRLLARRTSLSLPSISLREEGVVAGLCNTRLSHQPHLGGLKHLNRLDQVLAREEVRRAGWDEGLMLDHRQRPRELTAMNLFARFGNRLVTPPCDDAGVAGVARAWCLEQAPSQGLTAEVRHLSLRRLREADELFVCNSVAGVMPVRKLAVWSWRPGSAARALGHAFESLFGES